MFWAFHLRTERLRQITVVTGQATGFTWHNDGVVSEPHGKTSTGYIRFYYEECYGHPGSHIFPFRILDEDIDGFEVKAEIRSNSVTGNDLSNHEVLEAPDSLSNSMNYVYDTFMWDHCASEGEAFEVAWRETKPSAEKLCYQRDDRVAAVYTKFKGTIAEQTK